MPREMEQVNFKCPSGLLNAIDMDIESTKEFRNRSEWIVAAIRHYEEYRTELKSKRSSETDDYIPAPEVDFQRMT